MTNKFIKKKSIYLTGLKKIRIKEVFQKIKNDDIVVKVDSCGICSSDLKFIYTGSRIKKYPIILGHEISGSIWQVGKKSKNIKIGNHIVFGAEIPCNKCQSCKKLPKNTNLCDHPMSIGSNIDGGFSNYFIINKKILKSIPYVVYKNKKNAKFASLSESLACVINGLEITNFKKNGTIAIIGAGYMGLLFVGLAKLMKAKVVSIIDFNSKRLKVAKALGANYIFKSSKNMKANLEKKILSPTNHLGYDVVISANGNLKSHALACKLIGKMGVINLFGGIPKNRNQNLKLDTNFIHYRQAKITGSFSANQNHLNKSFKIIKNKLIDFSKIVTSYANYDNFIEKINCLKKQSEIKCICKQN